MRGLIDGAAKTCVRIGAVLLATMMLLTVADVLMRALFNYPLRGTYELVELLLCATFFFALPAVFLRDDHIVVDSIDRVVPRAVPWLKRMAGLVAIGMLALMAWQGAIRARDAWSFGDVTSDLSMPRILYWIPLLFGLGAGAIAALVRMRRNDR